MNKINVQADTSRSAGAENAGGKFRREETIPISDEMAAAGAAILADRYDQNSFTGPDVARQIFEAMISAS